MLKMNTFNKLLAERSLDSHILWKGALRWALNSVKKAFHLNDNQLIMIIFQCRIQGRGPGGPGPLISGSGWPAPLYLKVWIRHSALEGGKAGKMTRELLDDTSEKKGTRWVMRAKQENTSRKRSSLLYSCFLCLLCKFSLSQCCTFLLNRLLKLIHSEMLARKSAICRFIGVFFSL